MGDAFFDDQVRLLEVEAYEHIGLGGEGGMGSNAGGERHPVAVTGSETLGAGPHFVVQEDPPLYSSQDHAVPHILNVSTPRYLWDFVRNVMHIIEHRDEYVWAWIARFDMSFHT